MKKTRRFTRHILPLALLASLSGALSAAPYGPKGREVHWVQPDGQELTLRIFGDEYYGRAETLDGFTVVYNPQDQAYHYAKLDSDSRSLVPAQSLANENPGDLQKGIDLPTSEINTIRAKNHERLDKNRLQTWDKRVRALSQLRANSNPDTQAAASINAATIIGDKVGLTILVQFPDDSKTTASDPVNFPVTRSKIERFCNSADYTDDGNTGSVMQYYSDQSGGLLRYTQTVTPIVTASQPRNYYNFSDYPTNSVLRDSALAANLIIQDAVSQLRNSGFDFSSLTVDSAKYAIALNVFYAGADSGVWANGLWPHSSSLDADINVGTVTSPIYLSNYQITNIENSSPTIGTFCHENGHMLCGFPDLYSYSSDGSLGMHCLMSAGNYVNDGKTPAPIDIFLKNAAGWATITDLTPTQYVTYSLPATGNIGYRIKKPSTSAEYFLVENRGGNDKWANYVPDKGLMIWHIDEAIQDGNANFYGTDPHFGVYLEQADGRTDLEDGINYGDSGDLYDIQDPLFAATTQPNSKWWNGSASGVRIRALDYPSQNMNVRFGMLPANTIIVNSPNGGEVLFRDSKFVISWEANVIGNLKIDLYKSGNFYTNIANNIPNTGDYDWQVPAAIAGDNNYTIVITTLTNNNVKVSDVSDAYFTITENTFPPKDKLPYGWAKPADADIGWQVTQSQVYEGKYSISNKLLGDGKKAGIAYTSNFKAGTLSFYIKTSTESGYDYGSFYIDGEKQLLPGAISKKGLTGINKWQFASYSLSAGDHTLMWVYTKDDSYGGGADTVWVDGVQTPPTTQEIAVKNQSDVDIVSNDYTELFPSRRINSVSDLHTFTIVNTGNAVLHGLKLRVKGLNPTEFVVGNLGATSIKPGESTTFSVKFAPTKVGLKTANVRIASNDANEDPFIINLAGRGLGVPKIVVYQPATHKLKDGQSLIKYGSETVGSNGKTKVFTVKNIGSGRLTGLQVTKNGIAKGDYKIRAIGSTILGPRESTTFKVTFSPNKKGDRAAAIHVFCNYRKAGKFDIKLLGTGLAKSVSKASLATARPDDLVEAVLGISPASAQGTVSTEEINGVQYLTLTVAKSAFSDAAKRAVEVSPNLVDWFSGSKYTTVVDDNEEFIKVRDNTPITPGVKRYIRLKAAR